MANRLTLLQVLPKVPPAVCGVGDYAWKLADRMQADFCIDSSFLYTDQATQMPVSTSRFPIDRLSGLTTRELSDFFSANSQRYSAVLLQLSTYGFQKRGVPIWLASAWKKLFHQPHRPRLVTMFHELAASGPVTSSAFWLRPIQNWLIRQFVTHSDGVRTNAERYQAKLNRIAGLTRQNVVSLPVFSNFGEPLSNPAWHERDAAMVMFGWGMFNGDSLANSISRAVKQCQRLGLSHLHVVGGRNLPETLNDVNIVGYGYLSEAEISTLLLSCRVGYSTYNPELFGKSTLMAAFASHGLVVICQATVDQLPDGLRNGVHLLAETALESTSFTESSFDQLSGNLRKWYGTHSLACNAASYAQQLRSLVND